MPIIAAIAHYQLATIHPYYDGNERTARLLTNFVLHKSGYGLKGIYCRLKNIMQRTCKPTITL
ncbi:MAG TPA: hypothetical protein ENI94_03765 [Gammaproteobacteria bacterium]|nr:hypothetical protein [Gammaproteobacteria bacterium]